jgi:catechol 2,3-dioxygenase-like lactoylglutathione lyase family enzyme
MRVLRLGYAGMRTDDVAGMTRFLRDVLGLEPAGGDEQVTFQRLPTHRLDFIEVYSREFRDSGMIPDEVEFMVAFVVDDIGEALAEVERAGLEVVGGPVWAAEAFDDPKLDGLAWFFVRAPDGRVYAIEQAPD